MAININKLACSVPELKTQLIPASDKPSEKGSIRLCSVENQAALSYYLFLPTALSNDSQVLVCVHGISRRPQQQIKAFYRIANKHNYIIIAPYFSKEHYQGYQRLEQGSAGYTPVDALHKILHHVQQQYAIKTSKFSLFGYSGGAQFAHRYAFFYPERIKRLIICSAGWFTFPSNNKNFPYGFKNTPKEMPPISQHLTAFLELETYVVVGELDTLQDIGLNSSKRINKHQGHHRLERAKRWVTALHNQCHNLKLRPNLHFITLKNCGHSFESCARIGNLATYVFI